jgi:hypothetical protein
LHNKCYNIIVDNYIYHFFGEIMLSEEVLDLALKQLCANLELAKHVVIRAEAIHALAQDFLVRSAKYLTDGMSKEAEEAARISTMYSHEYSKIAEIHKKVVEYNETFIGNFMLRDKM